MLTYFHNGGILGDIESLWEGVFLCIFLDLLIYSFERNWLGYCKCPLFQINAVFCQSECFTPAKPASVKNKDKNTVRIRQISWKHCTFFVLGQHSFFFWFIRYFFIIPENNIQHIWGNQLVSDSGLLLFFDRIVTYFFLPTSSYVPSHTRILEYPSLLLVYLAFLPDGPENDTM